LRPLLHRLGLDVRAVPLGPVPRSAGAHARDEVPFFLGAFPIVLREPSGRFSAVPDGHADVEVAYRYGGDALVVFRRVGAGGLLLVADSRFFSTRNVEGHGAVSKGNVRFVYELLRRYAGLSDEVEVAFPDPPDTP